MKKLIFLLCVLLLIGCTSDNPEALKLYSNQNLQYTTHPADQVFKEHYGYRVIYYNEDGLMKEVMYRNPQKYNSGAGMKKLFRFINSSVLKQHGFNSYTDDVVVYKDVNESERGYVKVLSATFKESSWDGRVIKGGDVTATYKLVEIHVPNNIQGGTEKFGSNKYPKYQTVGEIK